MRYLGFDFLRGLCAAGVAVYHVFFWTNQGIYPIWGRYFVYIFFALSGASLYVGYANKIASGYPFSRFYVARYARIAPLFCAALIGQTLFLAYAGHNTGELIAKGLLNLSLLFGFAAPGATSVVVGGWSLGIEFVFYICFPIIVVVIGSRRLLMATALAFALQFAFASVSVPDDQVTQANWVAYSNPAAFGFYFIAGCYAGYLLQERPHRGQALFAILAIPLFASLAIYGLLSVRSAHLVGLPGLFLPLLVSVIVYSWGCPKIANALVKRVAEMFGNASYGMYLLHPFVYAALKRTVWNEQTGIAIKAISVLSLCFVLALIVDRYYERPMRHFIQSRFARS